MSPQIIAAIIAAAVSFITLIGSLAAQYFGRRATSRDTERALEEQGRQLDRTLAEQREQLDRTLAEQRAQLDRTLAEQRARTLNERFATAAEMLGADKTSAIRLAGVYAMTGLADDWEQNRQTCIDVLCACLRLPYKPDPGDDAPQIEQIDFRANREVRHTIIRVITAHLKESAVTSWQGLNFDFSGVVFDGGGFSGVDLTGAYFDSAVFSGGVVSFERAEFSSGIVAFNGVVFSGADVFFGWTKFSGARVWFSGAVFSGGQVRFLDVDVSGGEILINAARFSGGHVFFGGSVHSGGHVSFAAPADSSHPPFIRWNSPPDPAAVELPPEFDSEPDSPSLRTRPDSAATQLAVCSSCQRDIDVADLKLAIQHCRTWQDDTSYREASEHAN
jgi:uncharacterized protein YjbI with pentapeptide repeats